MLFASSARCSQSKPWLVAFPGERKSQELPQTIPQMSLQDLMEPVWCERTQDISGYVQLDSTSPPLDEQLQFTLSTAQHENDFYMQTPGNLSPEGFIWENQSEAVLGEDPNMFDNTSYSMLHTKMKAWLPNIPTSEIDEFARTSMIDNSVDFLPHIDLDNSFSVSETSKVDTKPSVIKKPGYFSIFDNEEPFINDDLEISSCTGYKFMFDPKDEMEVAEEVVVTTELEQSEAKVTYDQSPFMFDSVSFAVPIEPKQEPLLKQETFEDYYSPPVSSRSSEMDPYTLDTDYTIGEGFTYISPPPSPPISVPSVAPKLHLDIEAAMVSSSHLLFGELPDTPEVLKPVLKPGSGFDLVNFLLANGDSNNNTVSSISQPSRPCVNRLQERRRGKSHLTLSDLKSCTDRRRGKPSPATLNDRTDPLLRPSPTTSFDIIESPLRHSPSTLTDQSEPLLRLSPSPFYEQSEPISDPSSGETSSGRPARKSAMKLKKMMAEGLLRTISESSDTEDSVPKAKRRRSISTSSSSRRRLNSDSDHSSICDNLLKYRERRDRNNLSSKLSRQKRKLKMEGKKVELKYLEQRNIKLKKRAEELAVLLKKVHTAWQKYLVNMKTDN